MKARSPEELARIEKAMDDPRGAALCLFSLALAVGGTTDSSYIVRNAGRMVDDLFDVLDPPQASP